MSERFIYAAKNLANGLIKIGISKCPKDRAASLSCILKNDVVILGVKRGTFRDESFIHTELSDSLVSNEWFRPSDEVLSFVDNLNSYNGERIVTPIVDPVFCFTLDRIERRALNVPVDITTLCKQSGVACSTVSRWRAGRKPRAATLNKLYRRLTELEYAADYFTALTHGRT